MNRRPVVSCQLRRYIFNVITGLQRARSPQAKAERREQLLVVAREMLAAGMDLSALSLNALARRAGMAKSNVYRYFETREAVLLALLLTEWEAWVREAVALMAGPQSAEAVVRHLASSLAARPLLCQLTAALPTVLERNLSAAAIATFKRDALALLQGIGARLAAVAPSRGAAEWTGVVYDASTLLAGLYPVTHPGAEAAQALEDPALGFFRRDLGEELARHLGALVR
jgi:AcrR family transcriptional regulator